MLITYNHESGLWLYRSRLFFQRGSFVGGCLYCESFKLYREYVGLAEGIIIARKSHCLLMKQKEKGTV